ncbi:MAG: hypothetical protein Fur0037_10640 [Planctomycetota bacterium]
MVLIPLLPAAGCCSLAQLFCGPDRSEWVQIDYATPSAALRTFFEALGRDNVDVMLRSLDPDFKRERGLDGLTARLAWDRVRNQYPYLHMARYAEVPARPSRGAGQNASFDLEVEGRRLRVDLRRRPYWLVLFLWPDGTLHESSFPATGLPPYLALSEPDDEGNVRVLLKDAGFAAPRFRLHHDLDEASLDQIVRVEIGQEWRIRAIEMPGPT